MIKPINGQTWVGEQDTTQEWDEGEEEHRGGTGPLKALAAY